MLPAGRERVSQAARRRARGMGPYSPEPVLLKGRDEGRAAAEREQHGVECVREPVVERPVQDVLERQSVRQRARLAARGALVDPRQLIPHVRLRGLHVRHERGGGLAEQRQPPAAYKRKAHLRSARTRSARGVSTKCITRLDSNPA